MKRLEDQIYRCWIRKQYSLLFVLFCLPLAFGSGTAKPAHAGIKSLSYTPPPAACLFPDTHLRQLLSPVPEKGLRARHGFYTVELDSSRGYPNWSIHQLCRENLLLPKVPREAGFIRDPVLADRCVPSQAYTGTGYDRGHLAPAGDFSFSPQAMRESFYESNIAPQWPKLNRGNWNQLEQKIREQAMEDTVLWVITGTLFNPGESRPKYFYKAVLDWHPPAYKAIAFLTPNNEAGAAYSLSRMSISVDSLEKLSGLNLFPAIPDSIQSLIERTIEPLDWPKIF